MNVVLTIKKIRRYINTRGKLFLSRRRAFAAKKKIVRHKGASVVDWKTKLEMKSYAKKRFGATSFWPWLAVYTEIRGEFIPGWIPDDYYSAVLLDKYNPRKARISEYKTFDFRMFPDFALQPLLSKIGPNFYDGDSKKIPADKAKELLLEHNREVVLKEDLGLGGHRVKFIASGELNLEHYAHVPSYIVQPVMEQHEQLNFLNSRSVNTVRVFTYLNNNGVVEIKYAILRIGCGDSRVDNASSGGVYKFIASDGTLGHQTYNKFGINIGERHPDTKVSFSSVKIPNYNLVLEKCKASHEQFPYLRFIGWDVAINKSGEPVLLEWNSEPEIWQDEAIVGPMFEKEDFQV